MTVHFPFQNTYAALPANFFARVAPTPVASPRLIKLNRPLAVQLGLDPDLLETPGRRGNPGRQDAARRRRSDRDGLCRPPVRALCSPARRRPRHPARRGHRQGRRPPRHPAQGLRAPPRSPAAATAAPRSGRCCANTSSARRCSRWAFRPRARSRPSSSGENVMRETMLPGAVLTRVASSHIRVGTFQYFAARQDTDARAPARRSRHRAALSGSRRRRAPLSRAARRRRGAAGRAGRALAAYRLHPWRDEHRQHLDLGRDHRLRPLRLHGSLRSRAGVLVDRRARPLRLRQPAADRAVESDAARRMPAAADVRRPGKGRSRKRRTSSAPSRKNSPPPIRPACARRSACSRRATATRRWCRTCSMRWRKARPTSPSPSAAWRRRGGCRRRRVRALFAEPAAFDEWAARWRKRIADEPQSPAERQAAMRAVNPGLHPAQPPHRGGDRGRATTTTRRSRNC